MDFITVAGTFASGCGDRSGGVVGGQIGYRWQTGSWVFGVEGQGDWADLSNTRVSLIDPTLSTTVKTDGIGLITGQIGYAWNASLLYVKGGAAVTGNRLTIFDTLTGIGLASASATRWGGTLGVGWEYGFAPNWSVGVEYDHLWMGHANNSFSVVDPRALLACSTTGSAKTSIWSLCALTTASAVGERLLSRRDTDLVLDVFVSTIGRAYCPAYLFEAYV